MCHLWRVIEARSFGSCCFCLLVCWKECLRMPKMTFSPPMRKVSTMWRASCCARFAHHACIPLLQGSVHGGSDKSYLLECDLPPSGLSGSLNLESVSLVAHCCSMLSLPLVKEKLPQYGEKVGMRGLYRHFSVMQAGWHVVQCSSSAFFVFSGRRMLEDCTGISQ